jgi:CRISPR-associated endonuclease/helicase Cas3
VRRPDLLAHSAPSDGAEPQPYEKHVANVRCGARARADAMLRFATPRPEGLLDAIEAAAAFHDLGKLDIENQAVLARGRGAGLPWDHVDAGVAHLSAAQNSMAAWLVRAHHAPGLPSRPEHFDRDGLGRRLRGLRWDERSVNEHERQIRRTNANLEAYVAAHEAAADAIAVGPVKATGGLTMRLALSCLVDADHADTARFDKGFEPPKAPEPRWDERLRRLDRYVGGLPSSGSAVRDRHRQEFYRACREADSVDPMVACEGPVGIGKTTAVTAYLLRRAQEEKLRRLIVVAPYTNIIVQTAERLREALVLRDESADEVVVQHHHRADFETPEARDLAVLWRAPVVITTAVQFFETLASNHPGHLRKPHALPGSTVFIDEAHAALPAHLWPQNWHWLRELAEHWSCRFVFASGSLARFWENSEVVDEPVLLPELLTPDSRDASLPPRAVAFATRRRECSRTSKA